jgi:predicted membrane-bound spermidine synthase
MERAMQSVQHDRVADSRLQIIFDDAVVSLRLATDATFEDVARRVDDLTALNFGGLLAIDVTLASPPG